MIDASAITRLFPKRKPVEQPQTIGQRRTEDRRRLVRERRALEAVESMESQLKALRDILSGDDNGENDEGQST